MYGLFTVAVSSSGYRYTALNVRKSSEQWIGNDAEERGPGLV
jgi:hypothetical protein